MAGFMAGSQNGLTRLKNVHRRGGRKFSLLVWLRKSPASTILAPSFGMLRPGIARGMIDSPWWTAYTDKPFQARDPEIAGKGDADMPRSTFFVQECPTCGRNLQVRVEYMGKQVVCQHCSARFEACEPGSAAYPPPSSSLSLIERADYLLQTTGGRNTASASCVERLAESAEVGRRYGRWWHAFAVGRRLGILSRYMLSG